MKPLMLEEPDPYMDDDSMDGDLVGAWLDCRGIDHLSIDVEWLNANNPVGELKVMVSNAHESKLPATPAVAENQYELTGGSNPGDGSGATGTTIAIPSFEFRWVGLWYDRTSGGSASGDGFKARVHGKG